MSSQATSAITHPVVGAVEAAVDGLGAVRDAALYGLGDDELADVIDGCERLRARVLDTELALVAEADGRDVGRRVGAASTAAWLRDRYRMRPGDARRLVELANRMRVEDGPVDGAANVRGAVSGRELPATAAALAAGAISPEHVAVVGKVMRTLPKDVPVDKAREVESDLAGFCREFDPLTVAKLGDCIVHMLEPETLDDRDADRARKRELRLDETTGRITGMLTAEGLAVLRTALDPLAAPAPAADGEYDPRSAGQRLADALVELARRAIAADSFETNHGISHRVMLTIGLDTLTADHHCTDNADNAAGGLGDSASDGVSDASGAELDTDGDADTTGAVPNAESDSDTSDGNAGDTARDEETSGGEASGGASAADGSSGGAMADDAAVAGAFRPVTGCPIGPRPGDPVRGGIGGAGELLWGGAISAAAARRIACFAGIQRVVLDPAGAVLDVGREYRTATPAQFAALIARDGGCAFPGCTRPPAWCIAHHIRHWIDGGPTDLDNLVLLCTYHHTVVHHHGWDVEIGTDRLPTFYPPPWVDPDREPRRNNRPRIGRGTPIPDR